MFLLDLGDGAYLQKLETRHAEPLFKVFEPHREELARWLPALTQLTTYEKFRRYVNWYREQDAQDTAFGCGIWLGAEPVGLVALDEINVANLSASMECWLIPPARCRLLGTRACQAIVSYAFEELTLERMVLRAAADNLLSRIGIESLGSRYEGTARSFELIDGRFHDSAVYALLAGEWRETCARVDRVRVRSAKAKDVDWLTPLTGPEIRKEMRSRSHRVFVVERQGVLVARLPGAEVAEITRFVVAPEAFGQQVGRRLFEVAEGTLRRAGATLLYLRLKTPTPAQHRAFLKRRGLRPVAADLWVKGL
ncbi:MAG: hypothetical protein DMF64_06870 [Acidobacteria bacterium]|nr:MAG: hypothetical protein DMF64_06870 [Acidobacteriota bacterium]